MARWRLLQGIAAALLAPLLLGAALVRAEATALDAAVVFVIDTSSSMDAEERHIARESHARAIVSVEVVEAIRTGTQGRSAFAYVEFARAATVRVGWTLVEDADGAERFAAALRALGENGTPTGSTTIGAGLIAARHLFESLPWPARRLVVDVLGDGIENAGFSLDDSRQRLLSLGVVINGMPLLLDPSEADLDTYYATRVIGGPGAFSVPLYAIDEMPTLLRQKILMELF